MIVQRYIGTASVIAALAFGFAGNAAAANVSLDTTGPDSYNSIESHTTTETITNNSSFVQVTNENFQTATTGDVKAEKNTSVEGPLSSGDASNTNGTETTVSVSNEATVTPTPPTGGSGGSTGGSGGAGGSGGEVQGASTTAAGGMGGAAVLPEVGASVPMDVSALRAAWHPQTAASTAGLAKGSSVFTAAMLITATLLSLLGALGSAGYARRTVRV